MQIILTFFNVVRLLLEMCLDEKGGVFRWLVSISIEFDIGLKRTFKPLRSFFNLWKNGVCLYVNLFVCASVCVCALVTFTHKHAPMQPTFTLTDAERFNLLLHIFSTNSFSVVRWKIMVWWINMEHVCCHDVLVHTSYLFTFLPFVNEIIFYIWCCCLCFFHKAHVCVQRGLLYFESCSLCLFFI